MNVPRGALYSGMINADMLKYHNAGWLDTDFAAPNFCETIASLADKNACPRPALLAHIVYFFR
jgi:hypothetical protein